MAPDESYVINKSSIVIAAKNCVAYPFVTRHGGGGRVYFKDGLDLPPTRGACLVGQVPPPAIQTPFLAMLFRGDLFEDAQLCRRCSSFLNEHLQES